MADVKAWVEDNRPGDGYGSGYGYGYGSGSGYGYGYGDGSGYGYGDGSGDGYGYGSGYGYGDGYGLKTIDGDAVYPLDGVATLIDIICGNIAKGRILNSDLTTTPCYIVKQSGYWAHGATVREAQADLLDKLFDDMPEDERIAAFWEHFRRGQKYPAMEYFDWHHKLTGSCDMGRRQFARDHGIDLETAEYTPEEFVELTKNAYGGGIIKKLLEVEA